MGVAVFAKVQGQVKFESPRTRNCLGGNENSWMVMSTTPQIFWMVMNIPAK